MAACRDQLSALPTEILLQVVAHIVATDQDLIDLWTSIRNVSRPWRAIVDDFVEKSTLPPLREENESFLPHESSPSPPPPNSRLTPDRCRPPYPRTLDRLPKHQHLVHSLAPPPPALAVRRLRPGREPYRSPRAICHSRAGVVSPPGGHGSPLRQQHAGSGNAGLACAGG